MKTIKKSTIVCTVMCLLLLPAISASALGIQHVSKSSGCTTPLRQDF